MKEIFDYFNQIILMFVQPRTTKALFQASVVLASAFIIGAKDQGAFLYKEELAAYEARYSYEEKEKVDDLTKIDCSERESNIAECKIAKHRFNTMQSGLNFFLELMGLIYGIFVLTSGGCVASFLLQPVFKKQLNKSMQPTANASAD